jgi:hypothetical protein
MLHKHIFFLHENHILLPPNSSPSKDTSATVAGDLSKCWIDKRISGETFEPDSKMVEGRGWEEAKKKERRADGKLGGRKEGGIYWNGERGGGESGRNGQKEEGEDQ